MIIILKDSDTKVCSEMFLLIVYHLGTFYLAEVFICLDAVLQKHYLNWTYVKRAMQTHFVATISAMPYDNPVNVASNKCACFNKLDTYLTVLLAPWNDSYAGNR